MPRADATKHQKEILGRFAGELCESGADGIVVIFSSTLKGKNKLPCCPVWQRIALQQFDISRIPDRNHNLHRHWNRRGRD